MKDGVRDGGDDDAVWWKLVQPFPGSATRNTFLEGDPGIFDFSKC